MTAIVVKLKRGIDMTYSLVLLNGDVVRFTRSYFSRHAAERQMYKLCGKFGLHIVEIYDDKHYKTYICNANERFFISREA